MNTYIPLVIVSSLFAFVIVYPVVEWNMPCGGLNDSCLHVKGILWEVVALLSLYSGDGMPITPSVDERDFRNVFPLGIALMVVIFYHVDKMVSQKNE